MFLNVGEIRYESVYGTFGHDLSLGGTGKEEEVREGVGEGRAYVLVPPVGDM